VRIVEKFRPLKRSDCEISTVYGLLSGTTLVALFGIVDGMGRKIP
jgi:hypothetical protein